MARSVVPYLAGISKMTFISTMSVAAVGAFLLDNHVNDIWFGYWAKLDKIRGSAYRLLPIFNCRVNDTCRVGCFQKTK